jgi:hypothetical protein
VELVLETLLTLKLFLFPWDQRESRIIAEKHDFDLGCLGVNAIDQFERHGLQDEYWGTRLQILAGVIDARKQKNSPGVWFKNRNLRELATLATLALALVTALVAFASLGLDARQVSNKDNADRGGDMRRACIGHLSSNVFLYCRKKLAILEAEFPLPL